MSIIPHITVLMPAYNAEQYIGEAIASVLQQTFKNFELLIINDGSTDGTADVINAFDDERIVLVNQNNQGVAGALNTGLRLAKAPYIARFDADDICYPNRLAMQYGFMLAHPEVQIIGSAADYMDKDGGYVFQYQPPVLPLEGFPQEGYKICPFIHSSAFYRKDIILGQGGYDINAYSFEDHLLWTKVLKDSKGYNIPDSLIKVRLNPESVTIDEKWCHPKFLEIKFRALRNGAITDEEGKELIEIKKLQNRQKVNEEAYHGLLAKKFLWDNYNPKQARYNLQKLISLNRYSIKSYSLYLVSLMPGRFINKLYRTTKAYTS